MHHTDDSGPLTGKRDEGSDKSGQRNCYDIKPVRKEEEQSYWKIPLCDDDATREK